VKRLHCRIARGNRTLQWLRKRIEVVHRIADPATNRTSSSYGAGWPTFETPDERVPFTVESLTGLNDVNFPLVNSTKTLNV
jgi:hypothetical protein